MQPVPKELHAGSVPNIHGFTKTHIRKNKPNRESVTYIGLGTVHPSLCGPADETAPDQRPESTRKHQKSQIGARNQTKDTTSRMSLFSKVLGTLDQRRISSTKIAFNRGPPLSDGETIARATTWMKNRRETVEFKQLSWEKILQELSIHVKGNQMPICWHTADIYRQARNVETCVCLNHPVYALLCFTPCV